MAEKKELETNTTKQKAVVKMMKDALEKQVAKTKSLEGKLQEANKPAITSNSSFGTEFPPNPRKFDMFIRIDYNPKKVFRFDGLNWVEVIDANQNLDLDSIEELIMRIGKGSVKLENLTWKQKRFINKLLQKGSRVGK